MSEKKKYIKKVVRAQHENPLSHEEAMHLRNIVRGGLMRKYTPDHVEDRLLESGHIRRAVGGLMPTRNGEIYDAAYDKIHSKK